MSRELRLWLAKVTSRYMCEQHDKIYPIVGCVWIDKFLQQLVNDAVSNTMLDGLILDIWNEPMLTLPWGNRSWI
jgi:hypothetical protein